MAEEQKTPVTNVEAEKDVQNVLAELKEGAASEKPAEDADEARIVAEAAKLGEKSEQSEEKAAAKPERDNRNFQRGGRFGRGGARNNNAKFDPSSQEQTDDPVQIRKQVRSILFFSLILNLLTRKI
jgi:lupus La protein